MQNAVAQLFSQPKPQAAQTAPTLNDTKIPSTIRTSISCSPKYHELVKRLAAVLHPEASEKTETPNQASVPGVYVDFRFGPRILVPRATVLSADVVDEMIDSLRRYREKLAEVQQDLARLSELGELPVEVMAEEGVIRVFFPNCDRERLEMLLMEKNVVGGVIHDGEGAGHQARESSSDQVSTLSSIYLEDLSEYDTALYEMLHSDGYSGGTSYYLSTFTSLDAAMRRPLLSSGSTASSQDNDILSLSLLQRISRINEFSLFEPERQVNPVAVHIVEDEPVWAL